MSTQNNDTQENRYDILQNDRGEILIMLISRPGGPEEPRFVYDGGDTAVLYRTKDRAVVFNDIAQEARLPLKSVSMMIIVEIENNEVVREYVVPVRIIQDINTLMK